MASLLDAVKPSVEIDVSHHTGWGSSAVCIPNISPRERRRRLLAGVLQMGSSAVVLAALVARGASRWWRLPLFVLFWGAGVGFLQWRDQT